MDRCILMEEEVRSVKRQIAIDLIRAGLVIALYSVLTAGIHQHRCPDDISLEEDRRIFYRSVDVGLGREVHDDVWLLILEQLIDAVSVPYIQFKKFKLRIIHDRFKCREVPGIRQRIYTQDLILRMLFPLIENEITSDKSGTAGNYYLHK